MPVAPQAKRPALLERQYQGSAMGLARLGIAIKAGLGPSSATDTEHATRQVLAQLRNAVVVLGSQEVTGRRAPGTRLLTSRLDRLAITTGQITDAAAARDQAALSRSALRFQVLTRACWKARWKVQSAVHGHRAAHQMGRS